MRLLNLFFLMTLVVVFTNCDTTKKVADATSDTVSKATTGSMETPGTISFAAANERYSANGKFNKWKFTEVSMKGNDLTSLMANAEIDLTSIWEKNDKLTAHLKAWDYFDVEKFAKANLMISNVREKSDGMYVADLKLDMRDKSQKMDTQFKVVSKKPLTVRGSAMVDRGLFGIATDNTSVPNMIEVTYDTVIPQ